MGKARQPQTGAAEVEVELERRFEVAKPALQALVQGRTPRPTDTLRRNVALHADRLPQPHASLADWRKAQKGPRIEERRTVLQHTLRHDAPEFRPGPALKTPPSICSLPTLPHVFDRKLLRPTAHAESLPEAAVSHADRLPQPHAGRADSPWTQQTPRIEDRRVLLPALRLDAPVFIPGQVWSEPIPATKEEQMRAVDEKSDSDGDVNDGYNLFKPSENASTAAPWKVRSAGARTRLARLREGHRRHNAAARLLQWRIRAKRQAWLDAFQRAIVVD